MPRSLLLPLAVLLALATGLGLLAIATTLSQSPLTVAPTPAAAAAATHEFYVAADLALRTGNTSALRAAVAPGYIDHAAPPESAIGIAGYARFLADLRAVCPDCRFTVRNLAVTHDQAAVQVAVQGHRQVTAAGGAADGLPLSWSALDVLRIVGGQVAERWSRGDAMALTAPSTPDLPEWLADRLTEVQVARFFLPGGTELPQFTTADPALLVVEDGAVAVRTDGTSQREDENQPQFDDVSGDVVVPAGDRRPLTAGLRHRIANEMSEPATVLILSTSAVAVLPDLSGVALSP